MTTVNGRPPLTPKSEVEKIYEEWQKETKMTPTKQAAIKALEKLENECILKRCYVRPHIKTLRAYINGSEKDVPFSETIEHDAECEIDTYCACKKRKPMEDADTREDSEMVESPKEGTSPRLEATSSTTPAPLPDDLREAIKILNVDLSEPIQKNEIGEEMPVVFLTTRSAVETLIHHATTAEERIKKLEEELNAVYKKLRDESND